MKSPSYLAYFLVPFLLLSCGSNTTTAPEPAPTTPADHGDHDHEETTISLSADQVAALDIRTAQPMERIMEGNLRLTGRVLSSPVSKARVTSPIGAKVVDVLVDEGAHVRKGQPLIALSDIAFFRMQEEYLTAKAEYALAANELHRQRTLVEGNATAGRTLQQAEAQATTTDARMRSLADQLRLLGVDMDALKTGTQQSHFVLRSPVDGRVNGISIHLDERVEPTTVLMEVIDLHHFHVHLNAYERDLAALKEGVAFEFNVINLPGQRFKGEVFSIGRTFDVDGRTIPVHAHVEQGSERLVEGMAVSASIPTTSATMLAVPDAALARSGSEAFVYVDAGSIGNGGRRFKEVSVATGPAEQGFTAISPTAALPSDVSVAITGVFQLRSMRTASAGHEH
ncbi:MAG TPA: efflux RND transporter periplasmic adaptor subunit [Flavobacteriales bacterium]